jgi:hypothetical protein
VGSKAVVDQGAWFLVSHFFALGIEHTFEPLEADLRVGVTRFGACIVLSEGGGCSLITSVGSGWPYNYR